MNSDEEEKGNDRVRATNILDKKEELEFAVMLEFWFVILPQFQNTSKSLQDPQISLTTCSYLYITLAEFVSKLRGEIDSFEAKSKTLLPDVDYRKKMR